MMAVLLLGQRLEPPVTPIEYEGTAFPNMGSEQRMYQHPRAGF